ncbi:DUF2339 domain-containing protein [Tsuneonella aeria]|nr:DUF2339 domain-containing protein [Tsuneonella aeria]
MLGLIMAFVAIAMLWRRVDVLEREVKGLRAGNGAVSYPGDAPVSAPITQALAEQPPAAPAAPEPTVVQEPTPERKRTWRPRMAMPRFDFEDVFGRQLPIWAGGVTLAVAGFFLVRWSIDAGLLTPPVRVVLAGLFGMALLVGAETAWRWRERVADPRVAQALAGAGLATLYAAFYLAGTRYGLIGSTIAFVGLAGVTAAGIVLSFRFGLPSAVLGLVGGFAAPVLVGGDEANLPLLTIYLALVTAGLALTGRRQDRAWLGIAALAAGLLWGALLSAGGVSATPDIAVLGAYLVLLGGVLPALSTANDRPAWFVRVGAAALASVQLAGLVRQGGFDALEWSLYLMLGAALAWFGWRQAAMREASAVAAAVGVALLFFWPAPEATGFAAAALGVCAIFALIPLIQIWRGSHRAIDFWQVGGTAFGVAGAAYAQLGRFALGLPEPELALVTALLAVLPALAAWRAWQRSDSVLDRPEAAALAFAAALGGIALLLGIPAWAAPLAALAVATAMLWVDRQRAEPAARAIGWAAAALGALLLAALPHVATMAANEFTRLAGMSESVDWRSPLRWAAAALAFVAVVAQSREARARALAEAASAVLAYGAMAQILPPMVMAWVAAIAAAALAWRAKWPGAATALLAIAALWAVEPAVLWLAGGAMALVGSPFVTADLPPAPMILRQLMPVAAALSFIAARKAAIPVAQRHVGMALTVTAVIAAHALFRHGFAAIIGADFVTTGLLQRAAWEFVLVGGSVALWRKGRARGAAALAGIAMAHFAWFTLVLHNPLWSAQAVGAVPIANAIVPAYAAGFAALWVLRKVSGHASPVIRWFLDAAVMTLLAFMALSLLRQAFAGSDLVSAPMGEGEDLLRSLTGIVLAVGFLLWGARTGKRSWRIGSLVLMVIAVLKVFLVDAADLGGLARIASFMALGFSLIGIGWFYSRQLRGSTMPTASVTQ